MVRKILLSGRTVLIPFLVACILSSVIPPLPLDRQESGSHPLGIGNYSVMCHKNMGCVCVCVCFLNSRGQSQAIPGILLKLPSTGFQERENTGARWSTVCKGGPGTGLLKNPGVLCFLLCSLEGSVEACCLGILQTLAIQSTVLGPQTAASPGSLFRQANPEPHPNLRNLHRGKIPRWLICILKFERQWPRIYNGRCLQHMHRSPS